MTDANQILFSASGRDQLIIVSCNPSTQNAAHELKSYSTPGSLGGLVLLAYASLGYQTAPVGEILFLKPSKRLSILSNLNHVV